MRNGGVVGARMVSAVTVLAMAALTSLSARATEAISACAEAGTPFATAEAMGARDGGTLRLKDGREVRLAGVIAANALDGDEDAVRRTTRALDALISGRTIALHGRAGATDRYGRIVAQVAFLDPEPRWVQAALVAEGAIRVAPEAGEPACSAALIALEREARATRAGLWAETRFALQNADDLLALNAANGRFAVVEGTVQHVGESGGRLFLDFGRRFSEDFTIVIPREARKAFADAGVDLKALKGKRVRARGVLFPWGGPAVELRKPAALELLGDGA